MNKQSARSFSLGILFTLLITWSGTQLFTQEKSASTSTSAAKDILDAQGYVVLTQTEYEELKTPPAVEQQQSPANKSSNEGTSDTKSPTGTEEEDKETEKIYKLRISSGMSPVEIAEILESEQIIKDAEEFERFLIDHDYHTKVQLGTFELKSGLTNKEAADIITKN